MEKKNTILLTVIAIATLLVAVVGATFAYFTASVTTTNPAVKTTTGKSAALASATMTLGKEINSTDMYPGAMLVKSLKITGTCGDGTTTCTAVDANIVVGATVASEFGSNVEWKLYQSDQPISCKNTPVTTTEGNTNTFKMTSVCKKAAEDATDEVFNAALAVDFDSMTPVISGTTAGDTTTVSVDGNTTDKAYYLVVKYKDTDTVQNTQQGKTFTYTIDFVPKGSVS